jgi:hypothetical protein
MIVLLSYYSSPLHSLALRESFTVLFGLEWMFSSGLECSLVVIPVSFSGGRAWFYIWIKYANISVRSFQTSPQLDQLRPHKKYTCLASTISIFPGRAGGVLPTDATTGCFRNKILEIQHTTTVRTNFNMNILHLKQKNYNMASDGSYNPRARRVFEK